MVGARRREFSPRWLLSVRPQGERGFYRLFRARRGAKVRGGGLRPSLGIPSRRAMLSLRFRRDSHPRQDLEDHVVGILGRVARNFVPASQIVRVTGNRKRKPFGKPAPFFLDIATHGSGPRTKFAGPGIRGDGEGGGRWSWSNAPAASSVLRDYSVFQALRSGGGHQGGNRRRSGQGWGL